MDKMQVYRPFHIVGFYSAFPEELMSSAEVYAGGFPARYSGRLSSVIDVEMRGGNQEHVVGAATLGPFLTGLRLEGPLNDNGLSLLAAARFSQIERTAPTILGQEEPLKFSDQYVKLQSTFETGRCGLTGLRTTDRGKLDPATDDAFRWANFVLGGRCVTFGGGSSPLLDLSTSISYVSNAVGERGDPEREASFSDVATKVNLSQPLGGQKELRGGLKLHLQGMNYTLEEKFQGLRFGGDEWLTISGYLAGTYPLGVRVELHPGLALTIPQEYGPTLEPRLRASWQPFGSDDQELRNYLRTQWESESERIFASQGPRSSCILCDTAMQRNAARRKCSRSEPQRCFEIVPKPRRGSVPADRYGPLRRARPRLRLYGVAARSPRSRTPDCLARHPCRISRLIAGHSPCASQPEA